MEMEKKPSARSLLELARAAKISPDAFLKLLWAMSQGRTRTGCRYLGAKADPIRVYRSRIFAEDKLPNKFSDFSYPPPSLCRLGRANTEGSPIFYASAGGPTTFVESRAAAGDIVVVSEFRCYSEMFVQKIGFEVPSGGHFDYEDLMHELFANRGNDLYDYSSRIAAHLLGSEEIHGLTYPSIESRNSGQNLALKTSFVDSHFQLINVTAYRIMDVHDQFKYAVEEFDFGVPSDGAVAWKGRKKTWKITRQGDSLKMVSNGWSWDAFAKDGTLVDPE